MTKLDVMPQGVRTSLTRVAGDLHHQFQGVFGHETIEALVLDSYAEIGRPGHGHQVVDPRCAAIRPRAIGGSRAR